MEELLTVDNLSNGNIVIFSIIIIFEENCNSFSEFQKPSLLKRGHVQNLSCEDEFYLLDNKTSFSQEKFWTWPRFKTEACGISEMAYCSICFSLKL